MGVITSFLKLFKPAPNDYVDVEKHINENYDKIDTWAKDLVVNDLTTGGASNALSGKMGKYIAENYNTNRKYAVLFDGSVRDFISKYKPGSYAIIKEQNGVEILNLLGLDGEYSYAFLDVVYFGNYGCQLIYRETYNGKMLVAQKINFKNSSIIDSQLSEVMTWNSILNEKSSIFLGNSGVSSIIYIQDAGKKTRGNGYVDKTTGKLYLCKPIDDSVNSIDDVTVTNNFVLATNVELAKSIYDIKEDNDFIITTIGKFRIVQCKNRYSIPAGTRTVKITLPFSFANTNYTVVGLHDFARPNSAIVNIELDATADKTVNQFSLTGSLSGSDGISCKFIAFGEIE